MAKPRLARIVGGANSSVSRQVAGRWVWVAMVGMVALGAACRGSEDRRAGREPRAEAAGGGSGSASGSSAGTASGSSAGAEPAAAPRPAPLPMPTFAGSARCAECHEKEHARWRRGWHAKALAKAGPKSVVGRFTNVSFAGTSSEALMLRGAKGSYVMRTKGQGSEPADYVVSHVVGGRHMQDTLTELPDGRWQILPVYFHVTSRQWVDYNEARQGTTDPGHSYYWTNVRRMVQHECMDCHVTGMQVGYDEASARWTTDFADAGVACETCHGPGAKHSDTSELVDIFQPKEATAELSLSVCASCHGPRVPLFPLFDVRHRYQPGQRYDDFYDPIVVVINGKMSADFFADGRPKTSSFEYQSLIQSACYRKGGATCLSCHVPPHAATHPSELPSADPDLGCRSCHKDKVAAGSAHTHHKDKAANRCVSCHMPKVLSGVLDAFADHALDVPSLTNTEKHHVPNACGVCHADKPTQALAAVAKAWWPELPAREARRVRLADAFDDATAPQSSQALTAVVNDTAEAPTLRGAALMVLAIRFGASAAPAIVPALRSPDPLVRAKACEALGGARVQKAADAVAPLVDDPALRVRLAATLALHAMGDPRAEPALRRLAQDPATEDLMMPRMLLGGMLARAGKLEESRGHLRAVVRASPYVTDALWHLAEVEARMGQDSAARALVERALALEPMHSGARNLRARLNAAPPPQ